MNVTIHQERVHPTYQDGCYGCRVSSIQLGAGTRDTRTESRPGQKAFMERTFAEFSNGDREAYRRLRADGLQPPRIAGSAHLEKHATTRYEVESGQVAHDAKALGQALRIADAGGFNPLTPATTPTGD